MSEKPKYFISVGQAYIVKQDGTQIPVGIGKAIFLDSDGHEIEPESVRIVGGEPLDPGMSLLKLLDPREWWRRHWWKMPALWKR